MQSAEQDQPLDRSRAATRMLREILDVSHEFESHLGRELTVNPTDLSAMEHLIQSGPLAPGELARRLGVTPPAVTASVDRLAQLGHVTRIPNPDDRRGILVTASPESVGRAMGIILPMILDIDSVLDGFTEQEHAVIDAYLGRVLTTYRQHVPTD